VWQQKVLDIGCGTGYGTFMLSWAARWVTGMDLDEPSVRFARRHFQADNLLYLQSGDPSVYEADVYVALEVLEHLDDPAQLIAECRPLVWSMPISDGSAFHKRAYSLIEIEGLTRSVQWVQSVDGEIVPAGNEWFEPRYALGVAR
jgi:2-polyprenyl-3-methyl-5-hydroxy-6-metoxy-1,4-benzoquinol methylase